MQAQISHSTQDLVKNFNLSVSTEDTVEIKWGNAVKYLN